MSSKLTIFKGDDVPVTIHITDADTGDDVDITGDIIFFTVKSVKTDPDVDAVIGPKKITSHSDPTHGKSAFTITHTDSDITAGTYYYDIEWVTAAEIVTTLVVDEFIVEEECTDTIT